MVRYSLLCGRQKLPRFRPARFRVSDAVWVRGFREKVDYKMNNTNNINANDSTVWLRAAQPQTQPHATAITNDLDLVAIQTTFVTPFEIAAHVGIDFHNPHDVRFGGYLLELRRLFASEKAARSTGRVAIGRLAGMVVPEMRIEFDWNKLTGRFPDLVRDGATPTPFTVKKMAIDGCYLVVHAKSSICLNFTRPFSPYSDFESKLWQPENDLTLACNVSWGEPLDRMIQEAFAQGDATNGTERSIGIHPVR